MTTLVLLPGLDGTGRLFAPLSAVLPAHWRTQVHAYPMDAEAGYEALTQRVFAALPEDGDLVLLGESFSGPIAIALAAKLGARLRALILCCTFARNPRPGLSGFQRLIDWLPAPDHLPASVAARLLLGAQAPQASRQLLASVLSELPAAVFRARLRMVLTVDATATLAAVQQPVLYLQAGQDLIVPGASATLIQRWCPQTNTVSIPGPHGLLQAEPVRAAQAMTSFLGTLR